MVQRAGELSGNASDSILDGFEEHLQVGVKRHSSVNKYSAAAAVKREEELCCTGAETADSARDNVKSAARHRGEVCLL